MTVTYPFKAIFDKENAITDIMETLATLSLLVFVIGSMASKGLSLKMKQIIKPLKDLKTGGTQEVGFFYD